MMLALLLSVPLSVSGQTAVRQWRDCLDYSQAWQVALSPEGIYTAGRGGLFLYDPAYGTLDRMNKTTGLNDAGVASIAYGNGTLVIAYNNSNIDLVTDGRVYNLSDIKRSEISGDKSIYSIRFHQGRAYLATGFGIVVVDLTRHEIKETYYIGAGGTYTVVRDIAFTGDSLYAATGEGLKRIAVNDPHPTVSDRWTTDHRADSLTVVNLTVVGRQLLMSGYTFDPLANRLCLLTDTGLTPLLSGEVHSLHVEGPWLTVCVDGSVLTYDTALIYYGERSTYKWGNLDPADAVYDAEGTLWVAHSWEGLIGIHADGTEEYHKPDGPYNDDNVFRLVPFSHRMMLCPGGHTTVYANAYLPPRLLTATGREWTWLDQTSSLLDSLTDVVDATVNPFDTSETLIALWGHGVASVRNNQIQTLYNENNTDGALTPYVIPDFTTLRTGALAFDNQGNLWTLVSNTNYALARRGTDGSWSRYPTAPLASQPSVDKLVWDSIYGYLWFCGRENMIYVHDGNSRMARVSPNNGSKLQTDDVTALVQDRNGNLWVGTNKGIKVIYNGYQAFANGGAGELSPVTCSNITITNGEFSEYLMAYESITAIAVDGANRKWIGTSVGGLYLISANGMEQLEHFTAENSPLFSNKIIALGIQPYTGEVYIGTDRGLQVYRSTATYAESTPLDDIHAFPNPVRPDYDGPIAIKGFTRDALVHITDAAGHTVYSTQAFGGQAIWNGRTASGQPVASGVYYVFASDGEGGNRSVTKILIVR